jgi:hypothetical protein
MVLSRAAASSIANATPSSRRQMLTTGPRFSSLTSKPEAAACARSANRRTDSAAAASDPAFWVEGTVSGRTRRNDSPATFSGSRLVASTLTC